MWYSEIFFLPHQKRSSLNVASKSLLRYNLLHRWYQLNRSYFRFQSSEIRRFSFIASSSLPSPSKSFNRLEVFENFFIFNRHLQGRLLHKSLLHSFSPSRTTNPKLPFHHCFHLDRRIQTIHQIWIPKTFGNIIASHWRSKAHTSFNRAKVELKIWESYRKIFIVNGRTTFMFTQKFVIIVQHHQTLNLIYPMVSDFRCNIET